MMIESRSINENDLVEMVVERSSMNNDDDEQSERLLASYRHRFEHSPNMKKLRWAMESKSDRAFCDFCDLVVPLVKIFSIEFYLFFLKLFLPKVRFLIETNQTDNVESVINKLCKEIKLINVDVCTGALHEYQVQHFL